MSEEFNSKLFTFNSKEWIKIIHSRDLHFFFASHKTFDY